MSVPVKRSSTKFPYLDKEITKNALILAKGHGVELKFRDKQGPGKTDFCVIVLKKSFKELAEAMMKVDSEEAVKAFGAALQSGIQPKAPDF